jgi:signal transduction histidine kinase
MFQYHPSIRQKITFGYYSIVFVVMCLSVFTFIELRYIEKKVIFGEVISEFFNTTLEMRRFEKNFFLYEKSPDYKENIEYITKAQELLDKNVKGFRSISDGGRITELGNKLTTYRELMARYAALTARLKREESPYRAVLENKIRETGKGIITIAEELSNTERKYLQTLLSKSRNILLFSILSLSVIGIVIGQILSRSIVKPLKTLENSMEIISDGRFERIYINSKDREIVSLTKAFNKMLKELDLRQRHLVQSEKLASLGILLSGVAHELNNPLSNISTSSEILKEEIEGQDTDYKLELLSQIEEQTDRARNIVRSLLEFSRDKEFKKEAVGLKNIFEETIRFVKGQVPAQVGIHLEVPEDIVIFADKQRIQQAFLNLIKNAVEAVAGEGYVFIRAWKHRAIDKAEDDTGIYNYMKYRGKCTLEEDTVDIEIKDTGAGIPHEFLQKIFDPFFTTKDVGKGSGLGLFIVHEIVEEHDGCIAVDSKPGQGTVFLIRLPVKELR